VHPFLRDLLLYYGLEICHLTPNSFLHIVIFIHLCEAYLGIRPHFNLFCHLFVVKPHPDGKTSKVVDGAGVQLKQKRFGDYLHVPTRSSNMGWHRE
jgi:hypothetical protein